MSEDFQAHRAEELQRLVESMEAKNQRLSNALTQVRGEILKMQEKLRQVNRPPQTLAVFLEADVMARQVVVMVAGRRMRLAAGPDLDMNTLSVGQMVRLDESMVVVALDSFPRTGTMAAVREIVGHDRVLVTTEGGQEHLLELAGPLRHGNLRPGDSVMVDLRVGLAVERLVRSDVEQLLTPEIPDVTYDDIGGLDAQIQQVRDAVEMPFRHPELYRTFGLRPPKGILLYGPPGSGKTLIAKAVANSLSTAQAGQRTYFLSIKGPELLNKFVGETERQIRAIFARARTLAQGDVPVVLFFDEMESLFRTRGSGISSDVETMIVPQLLAEMDGVEALDNVVIIGASNRADMIDPAVLRPGRLDVRIRVERPDRDGARDIFHKHLGPDVPLVGGLEAAVSRRDMVEAALDLLFTRDQDTALFDADLPGGRTRRIHLADVISGAMIAGIVERAKKAAIKDSIDSGTVGMRTAHLLHGVAEEMRESIDLAATTTAQDWARTIGLGEEILAVHPIGRHA
ncbi:proteasome ATPase [Schaalia sp. 19OD2882]|uniref:proteasome ATPase n=1 Tax=Schaalia sp. 19OD2882 TaxID=2794089 RepID=UPI001C1F0BAD|nr:proteasome ATPase [Schaalia sp. 19OD2882]QWW18724.1 proteasome ATPase [Schaalia sp. 19OD2882]